MPSSGGGSAGTDNLAQDVKGFNADMHPTIATMMIPYLQKFGRVQMKINDGNGGCDMEPNPNFAKVYDDVQ